jgi:hypothetical protein
MSRFSRLFGSPAARPARKTRLGVQALEGREVPATFAVGMFDDVVNPFDGILSLREAITRANNLPGPDVIRLQAGDYHVTRTGIDDTNLLGDFDVKGSVTFKGAGIKTTRIVGDHAERLFELHGPITARFQDLGLFDGGNAQADGGAVQAVAANIVLDRVVANGNVARKGGAVNAEHGNVTVRDSRLGFNVAIVSGGAIAAGRGTVFLDRTEVAENTSDGAGGGIFVGTGRLTVARSNVHDNTAAGDGGGIFSGGAPVRLSGTGVEQNKAVDGGGLRVLGTLTADDGRIRFNQARGQGGGVSADAVTLVRSDVSLNRADNSGGGVFAKSAALDRTVVFSNSGGNDGGGLTVEGTARLTASTVHGNVTGGDGGGLNAVHVVLNRSTVSGNLATRAGGGLSAVTADLTNSTVSGNTAGHGAGLRLGFGGTIRNSTIAFNHAGRFGGGIENEVGAVRVQNTIIARNIAAEFGRDVFGLFDSLGHNLVQDADSGNPATDFTNPVNRDILGVDPQLAPLAINGGLTPTHALLAGSPAIDHGSNAGSPAVDQRGVLRPRDGDGNGIRIVDIGAFEV